MCIQILSFKEKLQALLYDVCLLVQIDAVTGHSTLEAEEIGLPRNSVDLMDGISGSATRSPGPAPPSQGLDSIQESQPGSLP